MDRSERKSTEKGRKDNGEKKWVLFGAFWNWQSELYVHNFYCIVTNNLHSCWKLEVSWVSRIKSNNHWKFSRKMEALCFATPLSDFTHIRLLLNKVWGHFACYTMMKFLISCKIFPWQKNASCFLKPLKHENFSDNWIVVTFVDKYLKEQFLPSFPFKVPTGSIRSPSTLSIRTHGSS